MIDSLRGNPVLKDVATLIQTIQQKLPTTVSVEVLQKILDTKDGYKYLANIDGTLTEMIAKQDLQDGIKYWADGIKNQTTNMLVLDNLVQKPQMLQNEIFKNETLASILGFDKLVDVVAEEFGQSAPQSTQNTNTQQPAPNMNSKDVIRLAAADTDLIKTTQTTQSGQTTQSAPTTQNAQNQNAPQATVQEPKSDNVKTQTPQPQKTEEPAAVAKQSIADAKENVAKELKDIVKQAKENIQTTEQPKPQTEKQSVQLQTNEALKQTKAEQSTKQEQKTDIPKETPQKEATAKEELKEKLKNFKNIAESPAPPTKAELEKAKLQAKEEIKIAASQSEQKAQPIETQKSEIVERIATTLMQNFEMLPKSMLDDAVKKLADVIFGKFTPQETDENIKKILDYLQKQAEQKTQKDDGKDAVKNATTSSESVEDAKQETSKKEVLDSAKTEDKTQKSENNPASKIKAQILEELAKTGSKVEFGILSNVAMALNKEVFTFVLPEKGVLQFRKKNNKQKEKELNAKTVEFYSAFETLGPISGEITHLDNEGTNLSLNVEFESTYRFLKETLDQLSFFDKKNVSITHGIKEIVEIKSSFLDTIG